MPEKRQPFISITSPFFSDLNYRGVRAGDSSKFLLDHAYQERVYNGVCMYGTLVFKSLF